MVNRNRKMVEKQIATLNISYTTLGGILIQVTNLIKECGKDVDVSVHSYYSGDTEYEGGVFAKVEETDKEMKGRIAREEEDEKWREDRDRKEYARLSHKFFSK